MPWFTKLTQYFSDVMSLVLALYAIRLTQNRGASAKYSYGWHRASILAALINAVFLLALCFSILMQAIERLVDIPGKRHRGMVSIRMELTYGSNFPIGTDAYDLQKLIILN